MERRLRSLAGGAPPSCEMLGQATVKGPLNDNSSTIRKNNYSNANSSNNKNSNNNDSLINNYLGAAPGAAAPAAAGSNVIH